MNTSQADVYTETPPQDRGWGLKTQPGYRSRAGLVFVNEARPSFLPASPDHPVTSGEALTKRGTSKSKYESDRSKTDRNSSWVSLRLYTETRPRVEITDGPL